MSRAASRIWRIGAWVLGGLLLVVGVALLWLLQTSSGARFALSWVPGLELRQASGTLAGPLTLDGLVYDNSAAHVSAEQIDVDVRIWPLLGGAVVLDALRTRALQVTLKPQATPAPPSDAPLELPTLQIDQLELDDTRVLGLAEAPLVIQHLSGGVATGAEGVSLHALAVRLPQTELWFDGSVDPQRWVADLKARVQAVAGPAEMAELNLSLASDGETAQVLLAVAGDQTQLDVQIQDVRGKRGFVAQLRSPGFDLARLGLPPGSVLPPVQLDISGDAGSARLDGLITLSGQGFRLDGTALRWDLERLSLEPVRIQPVSGGLITAEGALGIKDQQAQLTVSAQGIELDGLFGGPQQQLDEQLDLAAAQLQLTGSVLAWQLAGDAHLTRDNIDLRVNIDMAADAEVLTIADLRLLSSFGEQALGALQFSGTLGLAAPYALGLQVQAEGFDVAALAPEWPGELNLVAAVSGAIEDVITARIEQIGGTLRGAAISGAGTLSMRPGAALPTGDLQLDWGRNHVELVAAVDAPLAAQFTLQQPELLDPQLRGALNGSLIVATDLSTVQVEAQGSGLEWGAMQLAGVRLSAQAGTAADAPLNIELAADEWRDGTQQIQSLLLSSSGTLAAHALQLQVKATQGEVELAAAGGWDGKQWSGTLDTLGLVPGADAPAELRARSFTLLAPARLVLGSAAVQLDEACLAHAESRVCVGGQQTIGGASSLDLRLVQLPLELVRPWSEPAGVVLEGMLDGEGRITRAADGTLGGTIAVRGSKVELLLLSTELPKRFVFNRFDLQLEPDAGGQLAVAAYLDVDKLGSVVLRSDLAGAQSVLDVDFASLEALDDLLPDLVKPRGVLRGQLRREAGVLSGQMALTEFSAELPAANLKLEKGRIELSGAPDRIVILGQMSAGEGQLNLTGEFRPDAGLAGLTLDIEGERFLAANLPQARVLISPKLKLRGRDGSLRITGEIGIPEGRIDLARFEPAVTASTDVVYVDAPPPEPDSSAPLFADVTIVLGEQVELRGFGLDGRIAGRLAVRERPNRPTTARGEISVSGTYKAYGQDLVIERGKLLFANSGLDNPGLDIRAARSIGEIKAGVQVRGSANAPELTTYSSPSMDQLNTISYLVLGRPASQAGDAAGGQAMQNAAQQLGGNLLAKSIGQKLGLEVGIESSAALGGANAFSVGKYLSPRLFVGYGRSLYEELQLFIVRYKLREHYEIEATSGREQKIGINYRRER